jgi:predicted nicotinamide N-methyase
LEKLLAAATRDFGKVTFETVTLGEDSLELLQIADMPAYLDKLVSKARPDEQVQLPLWAKVWPAATILTMFASRFPFAPDARILEVGGGVGLTGLALAAKGHNVVISDIEPGAMLFTQINILQNGLEENATVRQVDVTGAALGERFEYIIGCELFYKKDLLQALVDFLEAHLQPQGEALFASDARREGRAFFEMARERFQLMKKDVPFKDTESGEEKIASLYRLRGQN